jgi:hypothetical protein
VGEVPNGASDITPAWLSQALGATVTHIDVTPIAPGAGLTASECRLRVKYAGRSGPATLIAKSAAEHAASRTLAALFGTYRTEVLFYERLAKRAGIPLAECYYAAFDDDTQNFVLLLDDLADGRVVDQLEGCRPCEARTAVERLADLHASFWDDDEVGSADWIGALGDSPLPEAAVASYQASWGPAQERFGELMPDPIKAAGAGFGEVLPVLMQRLSKAPTTLSHGDYRLGNMVFLTKDVAVRDWHLIERSRGARDLAYFIVGSLTPADRAKHEISLLAAYQSRLLANGVTDYHSRMCWEDYLLAVVFNFAYAVTAAGAVGPGDVRATAAARALVERSVAAIVDLDCLGLMNAN